AEKMASVGRLGAGIAHEVGNPPGAILGYLSLLGRHETGDRLELIQSAEREAKRIDRIVRGLLDFARPRDAVAQPTDVNRVLRDTVELVRTQGHFTQLQLTCALTDSDVVVRGDPYQLQQVLVNLLMNSAQALENSPDPYIEVTTLKRAVQAPPPYTPARRRGDPPGVDYSHRRRLASTSRWTSGDPESESGEIVELTVRDNGPGMPPELIDQIFEPFVTTKEPGRGTGLGLAVCARLIESMGGVIHAENAATGGAMFRVLLPAVAADVMQYRDAGYLPHALLNYLVRLGWSHGDQEVFSIAEMQRLFDLKDVNAKAARLDAAKLGWLNQQYLKNDAPEEVAAHLEWHLRNAGLELADGPAPADVVVALRDRVQTLAEMADRAAVWYRPL